MKQGEASLDEVEVAAARPPRSTAARLVLALVAVAMLAGFLALGSWQLQRRVWKLALIAAVDDRAHAAPAPAPGPALWPSISAGRDAYRRIGLQGRWVAGRETLVRAVTAYGAGYWVMAPLRTDAGFTVLVNRGFVPQDRSDASAQRAGEGPGPARVTGLLRVSEPRGGFLQSNAPAQDLWVSRDVAQIAAARGLKDVAPYFVDANDAPNPGGLPIGGLTVIRFPNSHLVYAITWFALAGLVIIASVIVVREERRKGGPGDREPQPPRTGLSA